jgi:hypothetical protein
LQRLRRACDRRLSTLRLDPPGGDARMRLTHIAAGRLAEACATIGSLCIGFRPAASAASRRALAPGAKELPFFDMSLLSAMPRRLLRLDMHASAHVAWPRASRAWPGAVQMHTLVLDVPCAWCVARASACVARVRA